MDLPTLFKELDLSAEQIAELSQAIKTNPMSAFALVQKYQIKPELIQKLIGMLMSDPEALSKAAKEMGVSDEMLDQVKAGMAGRINS